MCTHCETMTDWWHNSTSSEETLVVTYEPRFAETPEELEREEVGDWMAPFVFKVVTLETTWGMVSVQWYQQCEDFTEEEIDECPFCERKLENITLS